MSARGKVTTATLRAMKAQRQRISALTAYDHLFASLLDEAGVDVVLVGDSRLMRRPDFGGGFFGS